MGKGARMRAARERRDQQVAALTAVMIDRGETVEEAADISRHMVDNQIIPQEHAQQLRAQGHKAETRFVTTDLSAEGWRVTCINCGRQAVIPQEPPNDGMAVMCPACVRARRG